MQTYHLKEEVRLIKNSVMEHLINWYLKFCDGIWEHNEERIVIRTIDNPGFHVRINLKGCGYDFSSFEDINWECEENPDQDWIHCSMKDEIWDGFGSPNNVGRLIFIFLEFVECKLP